MVVIGSIGPECRAGGAGYRSVTKRDAVLQDSLLRLPSPRGWVCGLLVALAPLAAEARDARVLDVGYRLPSDAAQTSGAWRTARRAPPVPEVALETLESLFAQLDYHLERVRKEGVVPRLLVREMPSGLSRLRDIDRRKAVFIRIALPLILATNEEIRADRERIERLRSMRATVKRLPVSDSLWLHDIFVAYGVAQFDFEELLLRVDIIPPSLALAQAAEETGWGTSRFVRRGNALFGERTYRTSKGMVPLRKRPHENFRVRNFGRLFDAVRAYAANLNTHPAYAGFRAKRCAMRAGAGGLDAAALAGELKAYSERRQAYIKTIRAIMRGNALTGFDHLKLDPRPPVFPADPAAARAENVY